jgi:hypothetical protein
VDLDEEEERVPVPLTLEELLCGKVLTPARRGRIVLGAMSKAEDEPYLAEELYLPPGERERRVVACLRAAGEPLSARVISKRLLMHRHTAIEILKHLVHTNTVERVEGWEPKWALVEHSATNT